MDFDMSFLNEYFMPIAFGICLCAGYIMKHWIADVDNKIIPTVCAVLGVAIAAWLNMSITPEILLQGLFSGLASTGMHQAITRAFESNSNEDIAA